MSSSPHKTEGQDEQQGKILGHDVRGKVAYPSLLDRLNISSGLDRRAILDELRDNLLEGVEHGLSSTLLLDGLSQTSGDVQRITLNIISQARSVDAVPLQEILNAIFGILKKIARSDTGPSSVSAARTCASAFQALSYIFKENTSSLSSLDIQYVVSISTRCLRWGINDALEAQPRTNTARRAGPGSAFAFSGQRIGNDNMQGSSATFHRNSAFSSVGKTSSGPALRKQTSSSSLGSVAQSIASAGWESESVASASEKENDAEEENDKKRVISACRAVRTRIIAFLEALNSTKAKSLLLHWPQLLCESGSEQHACLMDIAEVDPFVSNRVNACHAIEAYILAGRDLGFFNGAEERTGLNAFTSLSSRIASTIVQMRHRLVGLLQSNCPTLVKEAALRSTSTLVESTSKARLRQTHVEVVRPVALRLCSSADAAIAVKAYTLLSTMHVVTNNEMPTVSFSKVQLGESVLKSLQDDNTASDTKAQAWKALAKVAEKQSNDVTGNEVELCSLALQQLSISTEEVRQGIGSFILAKYGELPQQNRWNEHVKLLQQDSSPSVRIIAADCLALTNLEGDGLARLCGDQDSSVRAASFRGIGASILKGNKINAAHRDILGKGLRDSSALVRQRASWSFGNMCEADGEISLLSDCIMTRKDDERVGIHAMRGVGALLANSLLSDLASRTQIVVEALQWISDTLTTSKDPKMRWNTCASVGKIFAMEDTDAMAFLLKSNDSLPITLSGIIANDKNFKTRLTASTALISLLELTLGTSLLKTESICQIETHISIAKQGIAKQVENASFREAQLHVIPLQKSIDTLASLLAEYSIKKM